MKFAGYQALGGLAGRFDTEVLQLQSQLEAEEQSETKDTAAIADIQQALARSRSGKEQIDTLLKSIKADETDSRILAIIGK